MNVFQFFIICKRTNNANNATHYVKLGKKRRESSKRNYYIISPGVIIKAIIIIHESSIREIRICTPRLSRKHHEEVEHTPNPNRHLFLRKSTGGYASICSNNYETHTNTTTSTSIKQDVSADDDACFYYHSRKKNVVIAFGTLWSFLT